jgi:hypothetical protein
MMARMMNFVIKLRSCADKSLAGVLGGSFSVAFSVRSLELEISTSPSSFSGSTGSAVPVYPVQSSAKICSLASAPVRHSYALA